jgi:hypothetical protein
MTKICQECATPIPVIRLQAKPNARCCVKCQERNDVPIAAEPSVLTRHLAIPRAIRGPAKPSSGRRLFKASDIDITARPARHRVISERGHEGFVQGGMNSHA